MSSKYPLMLGMQMIIVHLDIVFNAIATILFNNNTFLLMLYILQDTLIIMALIVLAISFSSTFVFQAGLIVTLLQRFSSSIVSAISYLLVSVTYHYVSLNRRHEEKERFWTLPLLIFFVFHRYLAVLYYMSYKRAALLLSDPKYHGISKWLKTTIQNIGK